MDGRFEALLSADVAARSRDELLDLVEGIRDAHSALDAHLQRTLAALTKIGDEVFRDNQWIREEVACALRIAPVTAAAKLADATELVDRLPDTLDRLADGTLTMMHARALADGVRLLDDQTAARVEARVLARCADKTVSDFRQHVKRAVLSLDPRGAEARHVDALGHRSVRMFSDEHGMATIAAYLRADHATALMNRLHDNAAALHGPGADPDDERTMEQKRADVFVDLTTRAGLGSAERPASPTVQVTAALSTLTGHDDQPAELDGYGPIPASLARRIAHDQPVVWRRMIVDPAGRLLDHPVTSYRPTAAQRAHVLTRDRTCRFPGCHRHARHSDLDHVLSWPHGPTTVANLHALCRRHHRMKHQAGWQLRRTPEITTWTSPTGRTYQKPATEYPVGTTTDPPPDDDPPPHDDPPPF